MRDGNGEPVLTATFDDQKRLTQLEAKLEVHAENIAPENSQEQNSPTESTPAESWDEAQLRRMMGW